MLPIVLTRIKVNKHTIDTYIIIAVHDTCSSAHVESHHLVNCYLNCCILVTLAREKESKKTTGMINSKQMSKFGSQCVFDKCVHWNDK